MRPHHSGVRQQLRLDDPYPAYGEDSCAALKPCEQRVVDDAANHNVSGAAGS